MVDKLEVGEKVLAAYKTGEYIGELMTISAPKSTVKILAVIKHPTQGDLHHPSEVEGVFFHQRRALSFQEKALVPNTHIQLYHGEIPDYKESLKASLQHEIVEFQKTIKFAERSLEELFLLKKDYFE